MSNKAGGGGGARAACVASKACIELPAESQDGAAVDSRGGVQSEISWHRGV